MPWTLRKQEWHPETGKALVRGVRTIYTYFRSQSEDGLICQAGIRPTTPLADHGIHDARDMQVSDRAINNMKAREIGCESPGQVPVSSQEIRELFRSVTRVPPHWWRTKCVSRNMNQGISC